MGDSGLKVVPYRAEGGLEGFFYLLEFSIRRNFDEFIIDDSVS